MKKNKVQQQVNKNYSITVQPAWWLGPKTVHRAVNSPMIALFISKQQQNGTIECASNAAYTTLKEAFERLSPEEKEIYQWEMEKAFSR